MPIDDARDLRIGAPWGPPTGEVWGPPIDEAPDVPGLGWLPGRIVRLPDRTPEGARVKVPHAGWNTARAATGPDHEAGIPGLEDGAYFYFTHAYAAPVTEAAAGATAIRAA